MPHRLIRILFVCGLAVAFQLTETVAAIEGVPVPDAYARIESRTLSKMELEQRRRVEQAYRKDDSEPVSTSTAAVIHVQEAVAGEVARALNIDATTTECEGLAAFARSTSKAPEVLAKVKAVFGSDEAAFLKVYIAPKVVEQKLRGYFVHSRELHASLMRSVEAAYAEARTTSASLKSIATSHGLEHTTFSLAETDTSVGESLPVRLEFRSDPLLALVRTLRPGELYPNIVENDEEFRIVRLLSNEANTTYTIESAGVRKQPYDEWFREQAKRVKVVFFLPELAEELRREYPTMPWWSQASVDNRKELQAGK